MPRDFAYEETLTPAPFDESAAFSRIPAVRRPVRERVVLGPWSPDLTWQGRVDQYEERYGEFSDYGREGPLTWADWLFLGVIALLCGASVMLFWEMATMLLEAMRNGAAEAVARRAY